MTKQEAAQWVKENGTENLSGQHTLEYMCEVISDRADWPYSHAKTALNEVLDHVAQSNSKALICAANELTDAMKDVVRVGNTMYWVSEIEDVASEMATA